MSSSKPRGTRMAVALATAAILAVACGSSAGESKAGIESMSIRYADPISPKAANGETADWFAKELEKRSGGAIKMKTFHQGSLLSAEEILPGIVDGRADAGFVAVPFHPKQFPLASIFELPFISTNAEAVSRAATELYKENDALRAEFDAAGVQPLFFFPVASNAFGFTKPVATLGDMSGMRLRSFGFLGKELSRAGVDPVFLATPEVYQSLQRGVIDGFAPFPLESAVSLGLHEAAPHFVQPGIGVSGASPLAISSAQWKRLSEQTKKVMEEAADAAFTFSMKNLAEHETEACTALEKAGGSMTAWEPKVIEAWKSEMLGRQTQEWLSRAEGAGLDRAKAQELLDSYKEKVAKFETESEYKDGLTSCAS